SARRIASRPDLAPPCTPVPATLPFCRWAAAGAFPWRCTPHRSAASASGCPSLLSFSSLPQHSHAANDVSVPHGAQEFAGMFEQVHHPQKSSPPGILQYPLTVPKHFVFDGLLGLAQAAGDLGVGFAGEPHVASDLQLLLGPSGLHDTDFAVANLTLDLLFRPPQHHADLPHGVADPAHKPGSFDFPRLPCALVRFARLASQPLDVDP